MNWFISDPELIDLWNSRFQRIVDNYQERFQNAIDRFNDLVGPEYEFNEFKHKTHNSLLDLMDKKNFINFQAKASQLDMARIYSISNSGAMSWTNVIYNWELPRRLSNQQMFIALSLVTGLPIFPSKMKCLRCKNKMDIYGHHCLSCVDTDYLYKRHDRIVDILYNYVKLAGFTVFKEARYHCVDGKWIRRHSRPGDIAIVDWQLDNKDYEMDNGNGQQQDDNDNKTYFDLTVGNIFCDSYIKKTSTERLYLAKFKEKEKEKKYGNKVDIWGLGLECLGGMSPKFRILLQDVAEQLESRTEISRSIWMSKMRSRLMLELIFYNTKMVQQCYNLFAVEDNMDDLLSDDDFEI